MKFTLILFTTLATVGLFAAEPETKSFEGKVQIQRVAVANPQGQRVCLQMYSIELPGRQLTLNAADKETAKLGEVDTTKTCTVRVSEDSTTHAAVILTIEQNGKILYTKPEPAKKE